jgi:hypothetical protein
VKKYRAPNGEERLWFEALELEQIVEAELNKAGMMPSPTSPVVDVERFIEYHLKAALDQYADLDQTVLGVTEFFRGETPRIRINKDLTGSAIDDGVSAPGLLGRWRATLAHEAGHVMLHRRLFDVAVGNLNLFGDADQPTPKQLPRCLKALVSYSTVPEWREVQANQAMAALLMPRPLFVSLAREESGQTSSVDLIPLGAVDGVTKRLAERLRVSKQAARIRLATLGLVEPTQQLRF